jgi:hypothetical protein
MSVTFCVPVLSQKLDMQRHLSCFVLYSMISGMKRHLLSNGENKTFLKIQKQYVNQEIYG